MNVYYTILTVLYVLFLVVIAGLVLWNILRGKKITNKIIGAIALIMIVLRILLIK